MFHWSTWELPRYIFLSQHKNVFHDYCLGFIISELYKEGERFEQFSIVALSDVFLFILLTDPTAQSLYRILKVWQGRTCSLLLESLWYWGKRNSGTASKREHDIDPMESIHYADLKRLVNTYTQQLVQIKCNVAVYGRDLYLLKRTLGLLKKFQLFTRAEEVGIIRLRIGQTKATRSRTGLHMYCDLKRNSIFT